MAKRPKINPGLVKLDLMLSGVRLDASFRRRFFVLEDFRVGPDAFGNLELVLPGGVAVSVPYQETFAASSPYKLRAVKRRVFLTGGGASLPVRFVPQPDYYGQGVNPYVKLGEVACVHGNYVALALGGHRYLKPTLANASGEPCRKELVISVDETVGVIERVRKDRAVDVVSLSCWDPGDDGGIYQVEPYLRAIKRYFNVLVFIEVFPPRDTGTIDETYAMGADSVCYHIGNLCSHGPPGRNDSAGREGAEALLSHAVSVFPPGSILAHITLGRGGPEAAREDIKALCGIGVLPILTVENLDVAHRSGLTAGSLAPVYGFLYESAKAKRIKMNWFSRLSPFLTPMEGRFFTGDVPRLELAWLNIYQSRLLGGSLSASLSNLRRRLRVRVVPGKRGRHS